MLDSFLVPSASPGSLASSSVGKRSFTLTWQPLAQQYHNGILTHFRLQFENRRTGRYSYNNVHNRTLRYTASSMSPYTLYECSVAAATVNGTGPYSSEISLRTSEDG